MKAYKLLDDSIIWEDGSRTFPPKMGRLADPPGSWPWSPPAGATVVDIATETPAPQPGIAVGEPYPGPVVSPGAPGAGPVVSPGPPPVIQPRHEIEPLPSPASGVDVWDRWQKLVIGWGCLIAWGGGDLDKLGATVGANTVYPLVFHGVTQDAADILPPQPGDPPLGPAQRTALAGSTLWQDGSRTYPPHKGVVSRKPDPPGTWGWPAPGAPTELRLGAKSAIGWWRDVQTSGADKATSAAELDRRLDVRALVEQFNDLAKLARDKGYKGCPPAAPPPGAPSPAEDALSTIANARAGLGRAWNGLSPRGKIVAGAAGIAGLVLVLRGVAK